MSSIAGIIQSFSINYEMFAVFEFLNAALAAAIYPAAFILGMEWASIENRVAVSCIVLSTYALGIAATGWIAMIARNFRLYMQIAFGLEVIVAALMFLCSESIRWLLVQGKQNQIEKILGSASKINNRSISPKSMDLIKHKCDEIKANKKNQSNVQQTNKESLRAIFSSYLLVVRFAICAFCWIAGTYVTYGVNVISVTLHGDKYMSFIITSLGGFPSGLFIYFMLKYFGRPKSISISLLITSAAIVAAKVISNDHRTIALILFFIAKCFGSGAFHAIYLHTVELWPTPFRHSMLALCSTIGRIGSILAPLSPLLV